LEEDGEAGPGLREDGNRLAGYDRQVQLDSALRLLPLTRGDILADGLRGSLHGFAGHLQIRE
jgi:hypothetical protein